MENLGIIERIGGAKGYWKVNKKTKVKSIYVNNPTSSKEDSKKEDFYRTLNDENVIENCTVKLSNTQKNILTTIMVDPKVTMINLANILSKNPSTIRTAIKILKQKGLLKRVGSDKTGYWEIIKTFVQ
jgi:predicted HTH transcriptional regulator